MPPQSKFSASRAIHKATSATHTPILDFLIPAHISHNHHQYKTTGAQHVIATTNGRRGDSIVETSFFSALLQASSCRQQLHLPTLRTARRGRPGQRHVVAFSTLTGELAGGCTTPVAKDRQENYAGLPWTREYRKDEFHIKTSRTLQYSPQAIQERSPKRQNNSETSLDLCSPPKILANISEERFAELSQLPSDFFSDIDALRALTPRPSGIEELERGKKQSTAVDPSAKRLSSDISAKARPQSGGLVANQLKLLQSVRELEQKLVAARNQLDTSFGPKPHVVAVDGEVADEGQSPPIVLSKDDYMNLVDLYVHSHNSRFSPEATDMSPSPTFLDDYSFKLSSSFLRPDTEHLNEDEEFESPLKKVHQALKSKKLREIAAMQIFVDLLLDDRSSNRALHEAYKALPEPGVAYLPSGVIRLFMQRMSTPWTHSEKSMLRYLALVDDMQKAKIPLTSAEWSSAIYLAGRSFARVTESDVASAFEIWKQMEQDAGVQSSHVTFNILFDIAVRAGKFALGQTVLMEMSKRNLRLNRLGRVSLIYYHGLRGDGDGVRKSYRDFVEAGEIVDTLVMNCVIASLYNAQEPSAAEQIYERMKSMYLRLQKGTNEDGAEAYYMRYPPPGESTIGRDMASNHLGRILDRAPALRQRLPEHHKALQESMPLVPDFNTFRTMAAYHVTKSGDLDRLSVLLNEMTDLFGMPLRSLTFQFLFKGFALHGPTGGPNGLWSVKRLDLCWNAFREALRDSRYNEVRNSLVNNKPEPTLPSITKINAIPIDAPIPTFNPPLHNPPMKRLSKWNEFVLDLVIFPRERLRRIERFHSQMFDDEGVPQPHESRRPHTFSSPFFQSTVYQAPEPNLDHEEGEYVLPNPTDTALFHSRKRSMQTSELDRDEIGDSDLTFESTSAHMEDRHGEQDFGATDKPGRGTHHELNRSSAFHNVYSEAQDLDCGSQNSRQFTQDSCKQNTSTGSNLVSPNRPLICWLLRAYARNTRSRARVEEIWGVVRKLWHPRDTMERESVIRVLRRCLRDCDREGGKR